MTASTGTAATIARQYLSAWLAGDVATAMSYVADDVVCEAPNGRIDGAEGYRAFLEPFAKQLISGEVTDILGDEDHAATIYVVETPFATNFRGAEYLTVRDGKITGVISVFDLSPALKAQAAAQN